MLITLSAPYGAHGSRIGPELARRVDVPFIDRAIPVSVSERLSVPVDSALARDESVDSIIGRLVSSFMMAGGTFGGAPPLMVGSGVQERDYQAETERVIRELAASGRGVILGRGGAVILREDPRAFHVRLDGPVERRLAAATAEGVDRETAERQLSDSDRARQAYVKHFYGVEASDASLYHLIIDSTVLPVDVCVDLIERAARAHEGLVVS
jgi:cytidylate kinase